MPDPFSLLQIRSLSVSFSGIQALDGLDLTLAAGTLCGIIGPNGSGKTTLLNCISRLQACDQGSVNLAGHDVLATPIHALAGLGISRTFQHQALFDSLTVREHLQLAAAVRHPVGLMARLLALPRARAAEQAARPALDRLLAELELDSVAAQPVTTLPLALRQRLDLARALASAPRLLLLDEPASGLDERAVATLARLLREQCHARGLTVLLIEHRLSLVRELCDPILTMHLGRLRPAVGC